MKLSAALLTTMLALAACRLVHAAPTVDRLIEALGDPETADWARDNLRDRGREAFGKLVAHLKDNPDAGIRQGCAFVLGKLRDQRAAGPLAVALADRQATVREAAAAALAELAPPEAAPVLVKATDDTDVNVRAAAVRALGEIYGLAERPDPGHRRVLVDHLDDPSPEVRTRAVVALGRLARDENAGLLAWMAGHEPVEEVRFLAVQYLAEHKAPGVAPLLVGLLEDPSAMVRNRAVRSLRVLAARHLGFDADAPEAQRKAALEKWRAWLDDYRKVKPGALEPVSPTEALLGFALPKVLPGTSQPIDPAAVTVELPVVAMELSKADREKLGEKFAALFDAGRDALMKDKPDKARQAFASASEIDNGIAALHANLGLAWLGEGKVNLAMEHLRHAAKLAPELSDTTINLAAALAASGKRDEALAALTDALKDAPEDASLHQGRATLLYGADKVGAARDHIELLLAGHVEAPPATYSPGDFLKLALAADLRRDKPAWTDRLTVLMRDTKVDPTTTLLMAESLRRGGKTEEALLRLGGLAESDDKAVAARASAAMVELAWRSGLPLEASVLVEHRKRYPNEPLFWWLSAWQMLGGRTGRIRPEAVLALAARAVELAPNDPSAQGVMVLAEKATGQTEAAQTRLNKALQAHPDNPFLKSLK